MGELGRIRTLSRAMLWRGFKECWWVLVGGALFVVGIITLVTVVTTLTSGGLVTGFAPQAVERLAEVYFDGEASTAGVLMILLWIQGPFLLATLAGYLGANLAQSALQAEVSRGGFEVLLSGPYRAAEVFWSWVTSTLLLTLLGWAMAAVLVLVAGIVVWLMVDLALPLGLGYWVFAFAIPLPVALWAIFISLFILLRFPWMIRSRSNLASAVILPLAMLPGLALIILINVLPEVNSLAMLAMATAAVLAGIVLAGFGFRRAFRPEALLES